MKGKSAILCLDHAKDAVSSQDSEEGDQAPLADGDSFRSQGLGHGVSFSSRTVLFSKCVFIALRLIEIKLLVCWAEVAQAARKRFAEGQAFAELF
ncbi:MAG: hypothetical protein MZV49_23145 [Rhodopseudomonas palustris]|nr:hypothetical protein [Rhodopseudomonas palustris]